MEKEKYLKNLEEVSSLVKKDLAGNDELLDRINNLVQSIRDFKVKVLCIGEFSAGKSAMLNSFLDINLLKEDILPETAIATELCYGEKEHVELTDLEGKVSECNFNQVQNYAAKDYLKYTYFLNNKKLALCKDYCFVDMPGFNSGIKAHNKALIQYVGEVSVYILAVDCVSGGLTASLINFIQEIQRYSSHIAVVITKSDKRKQSDINEVQAEIAAEISGLLGYIPMIIPVSNREQEQLINSVNKIIHSFSTNELFKERIDPIYEELVDSVYNMLEEKEKSTELDTYALDENIKAKEKLKENLVKEIELKKKQLHEELQNTAKNGILGDVAIALNSHVDQLIEAASVSKENFSRAVNNIVRSVLLESSERYIGKSIEEFIGQLDFEQFIQESNSVDIRETIETSVKVVKDFGKKVGELSKSYKNSGNGKNMYRTVLSAIAIATDIVAPWLELLLLFLPDIFEAVLGNIQKEKIRSTLLNTVIPDIISKLRIEITKTLDDVEEEMAAAVEKKITIQIEGEQEVLRQLKREKENAENNVVEMKKEWKKDLNILKLMQEIV